MTASPQKEYIITEEQLQDFVYSDDFSFTKEAWADSVRSCPYINTSNKVLDELNEWLLSYEHNSMFKWEIQQKLKEFQQQEREQG